MACRLDWCRLYAEMETTFYGMSVVGVSNIQFRGDMPFGWERNGSSNAFEIVGPDKLPIIQEFYESPERLVIQGIFPFSTGVVSVAFDDHSRVCPVTNLSNVWPNRKAIFKYPAWRHPGEYAD